LSQARLDRRILRLRRHITVLVVLLLVSLVLNALLVWAVAVARRVRYARLIVVDNEVACYVKNADAAEQVKERLLAEKRNGLDGEVHFEQSWKDMQVRAEGEEVVEVEEAVKRLSDQVRILVSCCTISVKGEDIAYMPTEADADMVLKTVKAMYIGEAEEAVSQEFEGDVPKKRPFSIPPEKLQTDLRAVAEKLAKLVTVRTVKRYVVPNVRYSAEPEERLTPLLPRGKRVVDEEGAPGLQSVLVEVELVNGKVVEGSKKRIGEPVVKVRAKPARVRMGTGEPD
jgi:hypothetical protein